jgi:hypothetical protein
MQQDDHRSTDPAEQSNCNQDKRIINYLTIIKQGVKHTIKKEAVYFLTMTVVDWIDVFTRPNHKDALLNL